MLFRSYDGSYTYGCGTTIDTSKANYFYSGHPDGTTAVGAFGLFGYGLADMAGNVWEWTSSVSGDYRIIHGGCWTSADEGCEVWSRVYYYPYGSDIRAGFRVCR